MSYQYDRYSIQHKENVKKSFHWIRDNIPELIKPGFDLEHRNPHHWQYLVIEGEILIKMPYDYILEMVCDWWALSWPKWNFNEIFHWYEELKSSLHPNSRKTFESILGQIKIKLEEQNDDV